MPRKKPPSANLCKPHYSTDSLSPAGSVIAKVRETISKYDMLEGCTGVVAAVSGGADSITLLLALNALAAEHSLHLRVAHLNHGLRGDESDEDERFVKRLANELGLPFHRKRVDVRKQAFERRENLESVAREERYRFLTNLAKRNKCEAVATGHTLDDQAETVLHHLVRSTGIDGLTGVAPVSGYYGVRVIRPLLDVTRGELIHFLQQVGYEYRTDATNFDVSLTRNYIRHEIVPRLEHVNPRVREALGRLAEIAREEVSAWEREESEWLNIHSDHFDGGIQIDREAFCALSKAAQRRIVRRLLDECTPELHPTLEIVDSIRELAVSQKGGRKRTLRGHAVVTRRKDQLVFSSLKSVTECR